MELVGAGKRKDKIKSPERGSEIREEIGQQADCMLKEGG